MKQNLSSSTLVVILVIAVIVIVGIGAWLAIGRSGAYYGGKRTVPRRPPAVAAAGPNGPTAPATRGATR